MNLLAQAGIHLDFPNIAQFTAIHITLWSLVFFIMIPSALWYMITTYFLKNRLNLD